MSDDTMAAYTVGHSNHTIQRFVELLTMNDISAIADVRSSPFSKHNPQFNKDALSSALRRQNIAYVFVGKELGARSEDPTCYVNGQVSYQKISETALFESGIERVLKGMRNYKVALMCAEKEPLDCHRTLLVGRALEKKGIAISHILADGSVESNPRTMARLLDMVGLPQDDMFRSHDELVEKACEMREQKIAYVEASLEQL